MAFTLPPIHNPGPPLQHLNQARGSSASPGGHGSETRGLSSSPPTSTSLLTLCTGTSSRCRQQAEP